MDRCPNCKKESVEERSSYKICHSCNEVFKPEWRKMLEEDVRTLLNNAEVIAAGIGSYGKFAVVEWCRGKDDSVEFGTHIYDVEHRALSAGTYYLGNDAAEFANEDYTDRLKRERRRTAS